MKTLGLIKPDGVNRKLVGKILAFLEKNENLFLYSLKTLKMSREKAIKFYSIHKKRDFFPSLIEYMTSGTIVAFILEGNNAVEDYRKAMGNTNPEQANKDTIRGQFGIDIGQNTVHGSDSVENAQKEIEIIFGKTEG